MMKRSLILLALGAVLALPLWLAPAQVSAQGKTAVQTERTKLMRGNMGALKKIGGAKDTASAAAAARTIAANAKMLQSKWPAGSGGGASRAKAAVWQNVADVKARLSGLEAAANNVVKVAASGDLAAVKKAFGAVRGSCGACHKAYRGPKKK
jgi:cytochrome c556